MRLICHEGPETGHGRQLRCPVTGHAWQRASHQMLDVIQAVGLHAAVMREADDEDALDVGELLPVEGGTWGGLLFDNPRIGLPPALTWSFRFPFKEVTRDYGSSPVLLDIDWLPLPEVSWRGCPTGTP